MSTGGAADDAECHHERDEDHEQGLYGLHRETAVGRERLHHEGNTKERQERRVNARLRLPGAGRARRITA